MRMTTSGQNVSAAEPAKQRRQGAYVLVTGRNRAHRRWSATEDLMLSGRTERFGTGALVEDCGSLQRTRREGAVETVSLAGRASRRRSAGGTRAGEPGTARAHAPVWCLLVGVGTVATPGVRSLLRKVPGGASGRCALVACGRGTGDQSAVCAGQRAGH